MAKCPSCHIDLGLQTSFALANFWGPQSVGTSRIRLPFRCRGCGVLLTYRAGTAGLFLVLVMIPMFMFLIFPFREQGAWVDWVWVAILLVYFVNLAVVFSRAAKPILTSGDPREGIF